MITENTTQFYEWSTTDYDISPDMPGIDLFIRLWLSNKRKAGNEWLPLDNDEVILGVFLPNHELVYAKATPLGLVQAVMDNAHIALPMTLMFHEYTDEAGVIQFEIGVRSGIRRPYYDELPEPEMKFVVRILDPIHSSLVRRDNDKVYA